MQIFPDDFGLTGFECLNGLENIDGALFDSKFALLLTILELILEVDPNIETTYNDSKENPIHNPEELLFVACFEFIPLLNVSKQGKIYYKKHFAKYKNDDIVQVIYN